MSGEPAPRNPTPGLGTETPSAAAGMPAAGTSASGQNHRRTACRLKQDGNTTQSWDTLRHKKQASADSFVKIYRNVDIVLV